MKLLLLIVTISFFLNSYGQNVTIPDANFKNFLVSDDQINTNLDAEIQLSEALAYTGVINCTGESISDLTGIEAFTALTVLYCPINQLTSLDVSQNTDLTYLVCTDNQLTSLDVSQNSALTVLYCANNLITSLDVSQNTVLEELVVWSNELLCLNVKNGNNINFYEFASYDNPNLNCIEVDDDVWSTSNWTSIDPASTFSMACGSSCSVGIVELSNTTKELVKIVDFIGRETKFELNTPLIYIYSDGTTERVFKMEK